jgi:NADH dehydrogenase (ubiquinone) Fe-S protein 1
MLAVRRSLLRFNTQLSKGTFYTCHICFAQPLNKAIIASVRHLSGTQRHLNEIELFIDDTPVKVKQGVPLIQACEQAGKTIPRFCYHDRLSIAGNCRMCLVEVEKSPKPVASCAMPAMPGMKVYTDTPLVKKAREGVMEFLLANHPLDCPICDQGGECDLQDQSVRYGHDRGRFSEFVGKRAVEDKDLGPLVKTTMTRCIQCTRCVRFAVDVAGMDELGTTGRGNDMQIGTYIEKAISSEMSGNIIDLCPVGALTSKPYAFTARPWELKSTESIDVSDAVGSNIRVDSRGLEVMRILPRVNEDVNEEWLSDKSRFAYDGLKRQRLSTPMILVDGEFKQATWKEALEFIGDKLRQVDAKDISVIAGQHADCESLVVCKDLFATLGSSNLSFENGRTVQSPSYNADWRSSYLFNSQIAGVDQSDAILLIGSNPKHEAPIVNSRIRKAFLNGADVALIGPQKNLNYSYTYLGQTLAAIDDVLSGKSPFAKKFLAAKKPMIIVGSSLLESKNGEEFLSAINKLVSKANVVKPDWTGFNILHHVSASFFL